MQISLESNPTLFFRREQYQPMALLTAAKTAGKSLNIVTGTNAKGTPVILSMTINGGLGDIKSITYTRNLPEDPNQIGFYFFEIDPSSCIPNTTWGPTAGCDNVPSGFTVSPASTDFYSILIQEGLAAFFNNYQNVEYSRFCWNGDGAVECGTASVFKVSP